jgi:hypothetical protein
MFDVPGGCSINPYACLPLRRYCDIARRIFSATARICCSFS